MCGIYFYPKNLNVPDDHFKRHLHHRGPDYQNQINTKDFVIGHTLLSIRGDVKISNIKSKIKFRRALDNVGIANNISDIFFV